MKSFNRKAAVILFLYSMVSFYPCYGQHHIRIDAIKTLREIRSGHLKMGDPGPSGREIIINNIYMTVGGKPVIPVMGEIHYSRYPKEQWEDAILKMKANGISIIACYVFWIHHEEIEGQFDWTGNKDLRAFIKLCRKHDLWVYPRIGPWCHGEVRNGGTPDWILAKKYLTDRSDHPVYQHYVDRLYGEISKQLEGLLYKDRGPVIGIQFENEYRRGPQGEEHILWLKRTALRHGIDVPMYTVTGWGNASVPQDEVIPLWGGYPAEPWATHIDKIDDNPNYSFEAPMNDESIGNEPVRRNRSYIQDYSSYPYFTCELGIGNQISGHRRPVLSDIDGLAIATVKTGLGSNLPGYYVFAGGINPVGTYTTMEENRDETAYWNEYPDISYDFQAAIRETGELAPSYHQVKKLHYFLNEFGSVLAPMIPVIPDNQNSKERLQYAMRVNGNSGFLFGMNYYRGIRKPVQKKLQFSIRLPDEQVVFPSVPVDVPDSCIFIWPVNLDLDGTLLKYATVQPLCRIEQENRTDWIFIQNKGIEPELSFDESTIESLASTSGTINRKNGRYILTGLKTCIRQSVTIRNANNKLQKIIILSGIESEQVWVFKSQGRNIVFISDANLYLNDKKLHLYGRSPEMKLIVLTENASIQTNEHFIKVEPAGDYAQFRIMIPQRQVVARIEKKELFDGASWLKSTVELVNSENRLYHKLFIKEFSLGNPSEIRSAVLYLYTENQCNLNLNQRWINQDISAGMVNRLDITGYVLKNENLLMLDFPFSSGDAAFVAKISIAYFNSDKIELYSDQSWLTTETYLIPVPGDNIMNLHEPEILKPRSPETGSFVPEYSEWSLAIPGDFMNGLNNLYLHLDYAGDKGRCFLGHRLISDNFNNGTHWPIELKRLGTQAENHQLRFEIYPLEPGYRIYFERPPATEDTGVTDIRNLRVIPEYSVDLMIQ
ncbi:MAG: beta-galactosidase [Bacteroidales bacterium]|nr:beta-galactosidase [Bacteroidales bacterium]